MRGISKIVMTATAAGALFALSACGSTETSRTATGAGSGAVAGAVVGGPVGAVVGGVGGAVAGNSMDESLSKKTDRVTDRATKEVRDETSGTSSRTSARHGAASMQGMSHDQVREIQQALNDRTGGRDITVDGVWGADTRRALMQFQRDNGLRATGRADERTMAALNLNDRPGTSGTSNTGATGTGTAGTGTNGTANTGGSTGMPSDAPQNQSTPQGSVGQTGTQQ